MVSINVVGYFKNILLLLFLYLFINNPILQITDGIGSIKLLYPIAILYLFINRKATIYFIKLFKTEVFIFFLIFLFTVFRTVLGGDGTYIRIMGVAFFENIFISIFLVIFIQKLKNSNMLSSLVIVGAVGGIISSVALLNPSFNFFLKGIQILSDFSSDALFRSFGLADGLTYSYGISQGIILSVLILNSKDRLKYFLFSPLFVISCLFNARTGILIVAIVLLYEIFISRRIKLFLIWLIIIVSVIIFYDKLSSYINNDQGTAWVTDFFLQISDIFTNSSKADFSTTDVLFKNMVVLPENTLEWLFGNGKYNYLNNVKRTDIGFFLQLKYGGVFFTLILYLIPFLMVFKTYKFKDLRWFSVLLLISFFVANIKGDFIPNTGAFRLLFLIYIYLWYNKKISVSNLQKEKLLNYYNSKATIISKV